MWLERRYKVDVTMPLLGTLATVSAVCCLMVCSFPSLRCGAQQLLGMTVFRFDDVTRSSLHDTELRALWLQQKVPLTSTVLWLGLAWGLLAIYCARRLLAAREAGIFLLDFSVFPIPKEYAWQQLCSVWGSTANNHGAIANHVHGLDFLNFSQAEANS